MKTNFDEYIERRGTGSVKWDGGDIVKKMGITERFDNDTLPLFTADMDIAVPECIQRAMHKVADNRIYGYTIPTREYYNAITYWFEKRHNWHIDAEEIVYCPGTVHAIGVGIRAFSNPGDGIIIQRPVYTPFTKAIESNNRVVANNQMKLEENGYYSIDLADFEKQAKLEENKVFILCNPHNPSGRIFNTNDLREMARICYENNVVIIADEIHGDLIRKDSKFTPLAKAAEHTDHIITCTAINKTFNVAGLHATNIVITNKILRDKFSDELDMSLPTPFTIAAVIAAYNDGEEWLEELKEYLDGTIDWVIDYCRVHLPKMKCTRPEGTYILWMDFRDYGLSTEDLHHKIYVEANVVLENGTMFDPKHGAGFERICLSSPRPMIIEAFHRIAMQFENL